MFIIGNFLQGIAIVISYILNIYMWVIIVRVVLSWVNPDPYNSIVRFIYNITEPVLYRIRIRIPVILGGIDLSPIIVFLIIIFLQKFLVGSLQGLAYNLL